MCIRDSWYNASATKIRLYKTVLKPVVMYWPETWTMTVIEEEWLCRWERKAEDLLDGNYLFLKGFKEYSDILNTSTGLTTLF